MNDDDQYWLDILKYNQGFAEPHKWIKYAKAHNFHKVAATRLSSCPDCGGPPEKVCGQYVYYSSLIHLLCCKSCELLYSDTYIDPDIIRLHFEQAYKDESYFSDQRTAVFDQIVRLADKYAPSEGRVMDIGGAQGHLLAKLRQQRPDLKCTLSDVSKEACDYAARRHGFHTICARIPELVGLGQRFEVVLMIDVMYYEPEIRKLLHAVNHLVEDSGTLIARLPNRLLLMRLAQKLRVDSQTTSAITFFNPEHVLVFSRAYLKARLSGLGFTDIRFLPSSMLISSPYLALPCSVYYFVSFFLHWLTFGAVMLTPSFIVIARRS